MRRNDREMNKEFGFKVIDDATYGILSMVDDNNEAYGIPLSIVRDEDTLYFHSATQGRKVEVLNKNPNVSIAFVRSNEVPELYSNEELDEVVKGEAKEGMLITKVFTTEFESAIVTGTVKLVEDEEERVKAFRLVCEKYTPTKMPYFLKAVEASSKAANVYSLKIKTITAKRKKYDANKEEMKWGRME